MTQKLHIKTWGCQMNEYDSSKMADLLLSTHGLELTEIPEEADVLLLNTCSIREKAQEKVFHQLGRWKELKKNNPNLVIGVGGCVASQEGEHIRHRAPYVDIIFGPQTLHRLPEMINQIRGGKSSVVDVSFPEIEKFEQKVQRHLFRLWKAVINTVLSVLYLILVVKKSADLWMTCYLKLRNLRIKVCVRSTYLVKM